MLENLKERPAFLAFSMPYFFLYKMLDQLFPFAVKHIDKRNLNQRVTSRLLAHGSAGGRYHDLCGQGRVVDVHVELE